MKVIFLGTPEIAVPFLDKLNEDAEIDVVAAISSPDRKRGRSMKLSPTPVKKRAHDLGIKVLTPTSKPELDECISSLDFDIAVVVAYGQLISEKSLVKTKKGFVNVHFSLLPKYRGASPIQSSLLNGDQETGVSIFKLVKRMDAGPLLATLPLAIEKNDNSETLANKLVELGCSQLNKILKSYMNDEVDLKSQDDDQASYCSKISKSDGLITAEQNSEQVLNKIRAFYPWPGAFFRVNEKQYKILEAESSAIEASPGQINIDSGKIHLGLASGSIEIKMIQAEGKPPMDATSFANGYRHLDKAEIN